MAGKVYQVENIYKSIHEKAGGGKTFTVRVPGSKSITNRALLLSMLSDGDCVLKGALFSDDSRYLVQCIADLGFAITADEAAEEIRVRGLGGRIPQKEASVYVGSAGAEAVSVLGGHLVKIHEPPAGNRVGSDKTCRITYPEERYIILDVFPERLVGDRPSESGCREETEFLSRREVLGTVIAGVQLYEIAVIP